MAASPSPQGPDGLVLDIVKALPDITDDCLGLLMQAFSELGVKSQEDAMMLAQPEILMQILGVEQAKRLVAHFNKNATSLNWVVTDEAWDMDHRAPTKNKLWRAVPEWCIELLKVLVHAGPQISAAYTEAYTRFQREQEKIHETMKDTLRNMDIKREEAHRIHDATVEELKASLCRDTQAEDKRLQLLREEDARYAEAEKRRRETRRKLEEEQELQRMKAVQEDEERWKALEEEHERLRKQREEQAREREKEFQVEQERWRKQEEEHEKWRKQREEQAREREKEFQEEQERWRKQEEEHEKWRKQKAERDLERERKAVAAEREEKERQKLMSLLNFGFPKRLFK